MGCGILTIAKIQRQALAESHQVKMGGLFSPLNSFEETLCLSRKITKRYIFKSGCFSPVTKLFFGRVSKNL